MKKIHNKLSQKFPSYKSWHNRKDHIHLHWAIFVAVAFLSTSALLSNINSLVASTIDMGGETTTVPAKSNRPTFAGKGLGPSEDHILVKFKDGTPETKRQDIYHRNALSERSEIPQIGLKVVNISPDDSPEEVVQRLIVEGDVEFAEVDEMLAPDFIPNDPAYKNAWQLGKVFTPAAWDVTTGNSVIVAILDTGVDCTHPDLVLNCVAGWNFYDNNSNSSDVYGHGTAVAGTAAAIMNNALGASGVCGNCKIMPLRISQPDGYASFSTIATGLTYAADHGARAANISYRASNSSSITTAAKYMQSKGGVVSISSGNETTFDASADNPYVFTVGATNSTDTLASWSNTGNNIDLVAPGVSVYVTTRGGGYGSWSGTSFAAPMVAGASALVISANPGLTAAQVQDIIKTSADNLLTSGWDTSTGWGRLNIERAVNLAIGITPTTPTPDTLPPSTPTNVNAVAPDSTKINISWGASTDNVGVSGYKVYKNGSFLTNTSNLNYSDTQVTSGLSYSYSVSAFDGAGNNSSLSTPSSATVPEASLSITSYQVSAKTANSATIKWTTNVPTTGVVSYGVNSSNLNLSSSDGILSTTHTVILNGLSKSTKYSFQITAMDGTRTTKSIISSFRTGNR
jgi:thermitase